MRSGEQDALAGQLVQSRARKIGVTVDAEIPAQIVPMHQQHIVTALVCCLLVADYRHLLSLADSVDVIGSSGSVGPLGRTPNASDSPMRRRMPAGAGRALVRRWRGALRPQPPGLKFPAGR